MQVRKFEASSMKEALEMIKLELGPEAIILSAQENKGFGLLGKGSVEVTAAISETQLKKRSFAQERLSPEDRNKFSGASAQVQRKFIEKSVSRYLPQDMSATNGPMRYVDIADEESNTNTKGRSVEAVLNDLKAQNIIKEKSPQKQMLSKKEQEASVRQKGHFRVKEAVQSAVRAAKTTESASKSTGHRVARNSDVEVKALKAEIQALRGLIQDFGSRDKNQNPISLHPGAERGLPFELSFHFEKLLNVGIDAEVATEILVQAKAELGEVKIKRRPLVQAWLAKYILNDIKIVNPIQLSKFHVFFGATGQGKTTALVKYAAQLVLKLKKRVAIVSCDTKRIAGTASLKTYSRILNCPFFTVSGPEGWGEIFAQLEGYDVVLIEMPSTALKSEEQMTEMRNLIPPVRNSMSTHFVQSVTWKDHDIYEILKRYLTLGVTDLLFTKLDEASQHGVMVNVQRRFGLPIFGFGIGPKVPEDFEFATKERVLDLIFKITKISHAGGE